MSERLQSLIPPPTELSGAADPLARGFLRPRTIVSFALAIGLLAVVLSRLDVELGDIGARLARVDPGLYLAAMVCQFCTFPIRALRWRELLRNVAIRTTPGRRLPTIADVSRVLLLARFAHCVVPAKLDLPYTAYLLRRSSDIPYSTTAGIMLAERLIELFTLLALLTITGTVALGAAPVSGLLPVREVGMLLLGMLALGLAGLHTVGRPLDRLVPSRVRPHLVSFRAGAFGALRRERLPLILVLSLLAWSTSAVRLTLVCRALGVEGLSLPVIVFAAAAIGVLLAPSITPGGLGVVESGLVAIFLLAGQAGLANGIDADLAVSIAILDRSISYWTIVAVGFVVYTLSTCLPGRRADRSAERTEAPIGPAVLAAPAPRGTTELERP